MIIGPDTEGFMLLRKLGTVRCHNADLRMQRIGYLPAPQNFAFPGGHPISPLSGAGTIVLGVGGNLVVVGPPPSVPTLLVVWS
jgi:hypothetical protein